MRQGNSGEYIASSLSTGSLTWPTWIRFCSLSDSTRVDVTARPSRSEKKLSRSSAFSMIVLLVTVRLPRTEMRSGAARS